MIVIENKTGKILWYDSLIGASFDIDNKKEMSEQFLKLKENFKNAISGIK
jgi:hypothetical protein